MTVARHDMAGEETIGVHLGCASGACWNGRGNVGTSYDAGFTALGFGGRWRSPDLMVLVGVATTVVPGVGRGTSAGSNGSPSGGFWDPPRQTAQRIRPVQNHPIDNPGRITLRVEVLNALPRSGPHHLIVC